MPKVKSQKDRRIPRRPQKRHFLLRPEAKTRVEDDIARMTEEEVYAEFRQVRFWANGGRPFCPKCGCDAVYEFTAKVRSRAKRDGDTGATFHLKRMMSCKLNGHQFSVTSGTKLAHSKRPLRELLSSMMKFVNHVGGEAALHLSRAQRTDYRTALVFTHKMRETMAGQLKKKLEGVVEIDGAYFGDSPRKSNKKENRGKYPRDAERKQVIVVAREQRGSTIVFEHKSEAESQPSILGVMTKGSTIWADGEPGWNDLRRNFPMERINHSQAFSKDGINTNQAESYFSRLRRAEHGVHHRIAGANLLNYAQEMAWREDNRRVSNGEQLTRLLSGMLHQPMSVLWRGYWQRFKRPYALEAQA